MRIYLLRHGIAEDGFNKPDPERAITPEGFKKLREVMKTLRRAEVKPSLIVSSPYLRARETAEVAKRDLGVEAALDICSALTPDSSPKQAWAEIRARKGEAEIMLVGHEPLFSSLTAFLLNAPTLMVDFKKAGVAAVDVANFNAQPVGVLCWYLTPRLAG